jgi:hypothetical protein
MAFAGAAFAADSKGTVEAAAGDFWAVRDGNRAELGVGANVFEFDILETGSSGSATVRFIDDSVIELRAGTSVSVKDVVFSEDRNRFNVGITGGVARVITGAIVRRNPRGFKMTTPKSTIGIRGTIMLISVNRATGAESYAVESMDPGHSVSVTNSATKEEVTITGQGTVNVDWNDRIFLDGSANRGGPAGGMSGAAAIESQRLREAYNSGGNESNGDSGQQNSDDSENSANEDCCNDNSAPGK